ncbi:hypothetical protein, partial [Aquamicrobium sp.]|uniref:hypothetical protein n=1 Tax=Aquamicrobium sp. TaxID=1872579 RepID=UPI00258E1679
VFLNGPEYRAGGKLRAAFHHFSSRQVSCSFNGDESKFLGTGHNGRADRQPQTVRARSTTPLILSLQSILPVQCPARTRVAPEKPRASPPLCSTNPEVSIE